MGASAWPLQCAGKDACSEAGSLARSVSVMPTQARLPCFDRTQPDWPLICAARLSISAGGTSSTWVATVHEWPNGSVRFPARSP